MWLDFLILFMGLNFPQIDFFNHLLILFETMQTPCRNDKTTDLLVHGLLAWHVRLLGGHVGVLSWQGWDHVLHAVWLVAHVTHTISGGGLGHGWHTLGLRGHILCKQRLVISSLKLNIQTVPHEKHGDSNRPGNPVWVWADSWSRVDWWWVEPDWEEERAAHWCLQPGTYTPCWDLEEGQEDNWIKVHNLRVHTVNQLAK